MNIWIDTVQTPSTDTFFEIIENAPKGVTFRMANTIDLKPLMSNPERFEKLLQSGKLVVDAWGANALTQFEGKDFYCSALKCNIPAGKLFEIIPNAKELAAIIDRYAIPKDAWIDKTAAWDAFPEDILGVIGLQKGANRTDVLNAAKACGLVWIYEYYTFIYTRNLGKQHRCTHVLKADGTFAPFAKNNNK